MNEKLYQKTLRNSVMLYGSQLLFLFLPFHIQGQHDQFECGYIGIFNFKGKVKIFIKNYALNVFKYIIVLGNAFS